MSQTFNLGGLGDNKLTKLIFSNGTANTCSISLDSLGYLVFEQGANTVTFPLGDLPSNVRLAVENGIVKQGTIPTNTIIQGGDDTSGGDSIIVGDITEDELTNAVADALGVENLFSAKSEPQAGDGVYPGFANAMLFENIGTWPAHGLEREFQNNRSGHNWSWSSWVKFLNPTKHNFIFSVLNSSKTIALEAGVNAQKIRIYTESGTNMQTALAEISDTSAWYHILFTFDVDNSPLLAPNQQKIEIYINNYSPPVSKSGSSLSHVVNSDAVHRIGLNHSQNGLVGYIANVQFIDGQVLDPSYFGQYLQVDGEESNIWIPKPLDSSVDYGPNGFYLDFSRNRLDSNGDIDMVHDVAPLTGTHTSANDFDLITKWS